jgi:hypothetical protein
LSLRISEWESRLWMASSLFLFQKAISTCHRRAEASTTRLPGILRHLDFFSSQQRQQLASLALANHQGQRSAQMIGVGDRKAEDCPADCVNALHRRGHGEPVSVCPASMFHAARVCSLIQRMILPFLAQDETGVQAALGIHSSTLLT